MKRIIAQFFSILLILNIVTQILNANNLRNNNILVDGIEFVKQKNNFKYHSKKIWKYFHSNISLKASINFRPDTSLQLAKKEYFPFEREPSQIWETDGWYRKIAVGDINNDGWEDIVVVGRQPKLLIFYNDHGTFNTNPSVIQTISGEKYFFSDIALKDFDNDNNIELFLVGSKAFGDYDYQCKGIYLYYFENVFGEFSNPQVIYVDSNLVESTADIYLKSRDIDKDGNFDIILFTNFSDLINYPICIFYNHNGNFNNEPDEKLFHPSYDVRSLALVNVNSDNKLDVFITIDTHNYFGWPVLGYLSENDTLPQYYNWKGNDEIGYGFNMRSIDLNNDKFEDFWISRYRWDADNSQYVYFSDFYLNNNDGDVDKSPTFTLQSPLIGHIDINGDSYVDLYNSEEMFLNQNGTINNTPLWISNWKLKNKNFHSGANFGRFTQTSYLDFISLSSNYDENKTIFRIFKQYPNDTIPPSSPTITSIVWDEYDANIYIKWQKPADNDIQGYALFYTINPNDSLMKGKGIDQGDSPIIIGIQDTITLSGALADTTYWFAISAIDKGGWRSSISDVVNISTHAVPPVPPQDFRLTDLKDGVVWAEWSPNQEEDIDHYRIYYKNKKDSIYFLDVPNTTIYHLTNLPCGDTLSFWLTAFDLAGTESQPSDTINLSLKESKFYFENVSDKCGIDIPGALTISLADINNDGLIDITFAGENTNGFKDIQLYLNESNQDNLYFSDLTSLIPFDESSTTVPVYIDIDKDGDKDLFLSVFKGHLKYFQNLLIETGNLNFIESSDSIFQKDSIIYGDRGISFGDLDEDGDLDMVIASKKGLRILNNFQIETGKLKFEQYLNLIPEDSAGIMPYLLDIDNDGDLDIIYKRYKGETDVFINNLESKVIFSFNRQNLGLQSKTWLGEEQSHGGLTWADVNKDGLIDIFLPVITHSGDPIGKHGLYLNETTSNSISFKNISESANTGGEPSDWDGYGYRSAKSASFADFDNDSWPDILIGNSMGCNWIASNFYRNVTFADSIFFVNIESMKNIIDEDNHKTFTMAFDADNDGDLDFLIGKYDHGWIPDRKAFYLYQNILKEENHYLKIKLEGSEFNVNAIGSRVEVYQSGFLGDKSHLIGMQLLKVGEAYISYEEPILHFGVGKESFVDVRVYFPYGTIKDTINVPVDRLIVLKDFYRKKQIQQIVSSIEPKNNSLLREYNNKVNIKLFSDIDIDLFKENEIITKSFEFGELNKNVQLFDNGKRIQLDIISKIHSGDIFEILLKPDIHLVDGTNLGLPYQAQFYILPVKGHGNFYESDKFKFDTGLDNSYFCPYLFLSDLNNDGYVDIAKLHYGGNQAFGILLNQRDGSFSINQTLYINDLFKGMIGGDWDNDGDFDLALRGFSKIFLLTNNGNGKFSISQTIDKTNALATTDIDADGDYDLIFSEEQSCLIMAMAYSIKKLILVFLAVKWLLVILIMMAYSILHQPVVKYTQIVQILIFGHILYLLRLNQ